MDACVDLGSSGWSRVGGTFETAEAAVEAASAIVDRCSARGGFGPLTLVGDFVLPPEDGQRSRDFQTLHFDFGLPIDPKAEQAVARYTALYMRAASVDEPAATRLVPLKPLLQQRTWPAGAALVDRLIAYGRTHGAWDDALGYTEGSLARIVEAAAGSPPRLPSVKADPGFLCGLEFDTLHSELAFFERHDLRLEQVEVDVALEPGELLVFDNLALAHGRRGARSPGELRQLVFGHERVDLAGQLRLRDAVLGAFSGSPR